MIGLAFTIALTLGSALLLVYWFRYMCLMILSAKTTVDYAAEVATANQLGFVGVQSQLRHAAPVELDRLQAALERDYALLTYLLKNASHSETEEESSVEAHMLALNYRVMAVWSQMSRRFSVTASTRALEEMAMVVAHLANVMGERAAAASAA
jgi:hypothetical protein